MLSKPQLGAAIIALSSCCPADGMIPVVNGCPEISREEQPATVEITPTGIGETDLMTVTSASPRGQRRKYRISVPNPVIDTQQKLWDCIFELKPHLMMECMEPIIDAGNCYNEGVNRIIDDNLQIPECRSARETRYDGNDDTLIKKALVKEARCLNVVMEESPNVLRPLDPCFDQEFACLREQIRNNSLVCTEAQQEARYGI